MCIILTYHIIYWNICVIQTVNNYLALQMIFFTFEIFNLFLWKRYWFYQWHIIACDNEIPTGKK